MRRICSWLIVLSLVFACVCGYAEEADVPTQSEPTNEQAWIKVSGPDGETKEYGNLADLIEKLEGKGEIFVRVPDAIELKDIEVAKIKDIKFNYDPDVFSKGKYAVRVTMEKPNDENADSLEDVDFDAYKEDEQQKLTVYVWVTEIIEEDPTPAPTVQPEETPAPKREMKVEQTQEDYVDGDWSCAAPEFVLSGIGEDEPKLRYAVIRYDATDANGYDVNMTELEGNSYIPEDEGIYDIRFAIVDEMFDVLASSEKIHLILDYTPPEVSAKPSERKSYTLIVSATDALSGTKAMSLDFGRSWEEIQDGETLGFIFEEEATIFPGMLLVKDVAGNVWSNEEEIVLGKLEPETPPSGGGGGGSSGPHKTHSQNTTGNDGKTGYGQAFLVADENPIEKLEITGQELTLSTTVKDEEEQTGKFNVTFGKWTEEEPSTDKHGLKSLHAGEIAEKDDMMVLSAVQPEKKAEGENPVYSWSFDGATLRTLYASGIDYLVFQVGDAVAVFPTVGFTAGTRYVDMKLEGIASRYFIYNATMQLTEEQQQEPKTSFDAPDEINYTQDCIFTLQVDVQDENFALVPSPSPEMYTEKVYCIPAEWLDYPVSEYPAADIQADS